MNGCKVEVFKMSWFFKEKKDLQDFLTSKEFKELEKKNIEISTKLELLELNYRILSQKIKTKLGKLPSEENQEEKKDFYSGVLLPE